MATTQQFRYSPWLVIRDPRCRLMNLAPFSDRIDVISVFGNPTTCPDYPEFRAMCRAKKIKLIAGVGGTLECYATPEARRDTVSQWLALCDGGVYDGVDIDIEHMPPASKPEFMALLRDLSAAFRKHNLTLTMCVGFYPSFVEQPFVWWYEPAELAQYVDQVRLMGYVCFWSWGKNDGKLKARKDCFGMGPATSYPFCREALEFWLAHVPVEKLVFGIPAYSNIYALDPAAIGKENGNDYAEMFDHPEIDPSQPVHRYWSWVDRLWVMNFTDNQNRRRIHFQCDLDSTRALLELASRMGVTQMSIWDFDPAKAAATQISELILNWPEQ